MKGGYDCQLLNSPQREDMNLNIFFFERIELQLMEEILHQFMLVVYPIIYRVLYIPGGAGFLPSTVGKLQENMPTTLR